MIPLTGPWSDGFAGGFGDGRITRLGGSGFPRSLYGSFEGKEEAVIVEEAAQNTGGWGDAWSQEIDDEAVRRQRVAMGIIPDEGAALEAVQAESRSKARQLARQEEARSQALTDQIIELERAIEAQEGINTAALEAEKSRALANLSIIQRNQNAQAVLVMLGLL